MQLDRVGARAIAALQDIAVDAGRIFLFMLIMVGAFLGTVLLTAFFHGFAVVTGDASFFTLLNAGGRNAVQVFTGFSDAESSLFISALLSALIMGSVGGLVYQKTVSGLGQFRQWARTISYSPSTSQD